MHPKCTNKTYAHPLIISNTLAKFEISLFLHCAKNIHTHTHTHTHTQTHAYIHTDILYFYKKHNCSKSKCNLWLKPANNHLQLYYSLFSYFVFSTAATQQISPLGLLVK